MVIVDRERGKENEGAGTDEGEGEGGLTIRGAGEVVESGCEGESCTAERNRGLVCEKSGDTETGAGE